MYRIVFYCFVMMSLLFMGACTHSPNRAAGVPISKSADNIYTVSQNLSDFTDFILIKTNNINADMQNPRQVDLDAALDDLARYDVVFVGEMHGHVANHILQAKIFSGLYGRYPKMALSMEQFERDAQTRLDQYLAGEIGEALLTKDDVGWSHYKQSYRPMVEFAKKTYIRRYRRQCARQSCALYRYERPWVLGYANRRETGNARANTAYARRAI